VLKLTRLNRHVVAVNPDHISWVDASPDTTLRILGGETLIVRESVDELIEQLITYRRLLRVAPIDGDTEYDPPNLPPIDQLRASLHRSSWPAKNDRKGG
jgi:flagellar protein FlbD